MDDKIVVNVQDLAENEEQVLVRKNDNLYKIGLAEYLNDSGELSFSEYDLRRIENSFTMALEKETNQFVTTLEEIKELAKNPQFDKAKVTKIYSLLEYYVNKDIFLGKTYDVLSNNINTNFRVIYPNSLPEKKGKKVTSKDNDILMSAKKTVEDFINKADIRQVISDAVLTTFTRGNYIGYLCGDASIGFTIDEYPLDMIEITKLKRGGSNLVSFDVKELKSRLEAECKKYNNLKAKYEFMDFKQLAKDIISEDYPIEISEASKVNDKVAILNPAKVGISRINNMKGQYGISPMFKALKSLLILEQIDSTDSKVLIGKTKKIFFQKLRSDLMQSNTPGTTGKTYAKKEAGYAQGSLMTAMGEDVVVYTAQPYVESLEIIEPKSELTSTNTVRQHKDDVINGVGIGFVSGQDGKGVATTEFTYDDLLKSINKIVKRQVEPMLNKFIQTVIVENGFDVSLSPLIEIQGTEMLDIDTIAKVVELYRNKLNLSMETIFEAIGLDVEDETIKRMSENAVQNPNAPMGSEGLSSVFYPYQTSYTMSGSEEPSALENKNKNGSEKSKDKDKALKDKAKNKVKK